ncbi:Os01g0847000 [Oryza sativa Japonica Group]|uniref:Os01g0847000 protein n=1 Tax=Oryza sativa subsp. japonica TaxID=39947 RepID=A0A0P0VAD5_ORYSJ|nr:hypothetical protein EE612_006803 [Oryza sativa]BAS75210.1 Os01g0847000 [Oryza sativa Japonica Group]
MIAFVLTMLPAAVSEEGTFVPSAHLSTIQVAVDLMQQSMLFLSSLDPQPSVETVCLAVMSAAASIVLVHGQNVADYME